MLLQHAIKLQITGSRQDHDNGVMHRHTAAWVSATLPESRDCRAQWRAGSENFGIVLGRDDFGPDWHRHGAPRLPDSVQTDLNELMQRIAHGDRAAFDAFYRQTVDYCMAIASSVLNHSGWAEDCVAEAYVTVWRQSMNFDPSRAQARSWLAMICRSRAIDRLRRERTQEHPEFTANLADWTATAELDPALRFGHLLAGGKLRTALAQLDQRQRQLLELCYFQGLSNSEIAAATGLPLGTVKSGLRRSIAHLRKELLSHEQVADNT